MNRGEKRAAGARQIITVLPRPSVYPSGKRLRVNIQGLVDFFRRPGRCLPTGCAGLPALPESLCFAVYILSRIAFWATIARSPNTAQPRLKRLTFIRQRRIGHTLRCCGLPCSKCGDVIFVAHPRAGRLEQPFTLTGTMGLQPIKMKARLVQARQPGEGGNFTMQVFGRRRGVLTINFGG